MLYASSTVDTITSCSQFLQTCATQTRKIDKFLTWYKALVLLCSLGEKSAKWVAIFSIIIRLQKRNNEWLLQGNVNNARSQLQSNEQRKPLQWPKSFIKPKKTFEWLMKTLWETKENIWITKENHLNYQRKPFEWLKKPIQWSTKPFEWSLQKTLSMTEETHDEQPSKRASRMTDRVTMSMTIAIFITNVPKVVTSFHCSKWLLVCQTLLRKSPQTCQDL